MRSRFRRARRPFRHIPHLGRHAAQLRDAARAAGRLPARIYQRRKGQRQYVGRRRDRAHDRPDARPRGLHAGREAAADRDHGRRLRRRLQRHPGAAAAVAARGLRQGVPAARRSRLHADRRRPALRVPGHDAGRGPHLDRSGWSKALHRPAFLPRDQQITPPPVGRRRVADRDQVTPRADRNRRLPRRRLARTPRLREMGRNTAASTHRTKCAG